MKFALSFLFVASFSASAAIGASSKNHPFFVAIDTQAARSLEFFLDNLDSPLVNVGAVMASPSQSDPDYFFHWTRDAAVSMRIMINYLESPHTSEQEKEYALQRLLDWVEFETSLLDLETESGFGEPKFNLDGTAFTGPWGRPQTDGPALRAVTAIRLANYLLQNQDPHSVERLLTWSRCLIRRDLQYLAGNWTLSSFDLWEEVRADHFYNRLAQWDAFNRGSSLAAAMGQPGLARQYLKVGQTIHSSLQQFVDLSQNRILTSVRNTGGWTHKASGLDVAVILAVLHSSQPTDLYSVSTSLVASTAQKLESVFSKIYALNTNVRMNAPAMGRYPEDVYTGNSTEGQGNPWFIATHAMAEFHCLRGEYQRGFEFLNRALYHAGRDGRMNEQFSRTHGYMQGAEDLTWSYASYLSAYFACTQKLPTLEY